LQKPSISVYEKPFILTDYEKANNEFKLKNLQLELQLLESNERIIDENLHNYDNNNKERLKELLLLQIKKLKSEISKLKQYIQEHTITSGGHRKKKKQMKIKIILMII